MPGGFGCILQQVRQYAFYLIGIRTGEGKATDRLEPILDVRMFHPKKLYSFFYQGVDVRDSVFVSGSEAKSENARTRFSRLSTSLMTTLAAWSRNCLSSAGCRATISSTVSLMGVNEFFGS